MSLLSEMLADSPGGLWMLDNTADSSGNSNTLTEVASPTHPASIIPTVAGNCIEFNGSSQSTWAADNATLDVADVFTLEAWVTVDGTGSYQAIIYKELAYALGVTGGGAIELARPSTTALVTSTSTLTPGTVYHVVGTKNGSTNKVYVNGSDVSGSVTNSTCVDSSNRLDMGSAIAFVGFLDGRVQAAAVYPSALSAARVLAHYEAGLNTDAITYPTSRVRRRTSW